MLTPKFLRAHYIPVSGQHEGFRWLMKLMYEFWGFCVNGGESLRDPGGFAPMSGVYEMPWSGSADASLVASGTDGWTEVGMPFFNAVNANAFSASYVGMHLVTWKSGSTSTDDSVYEITQWLNSSSIRTNVLQGGTPYTGTLHPAFTTRTNVNYRIVNFNNITSMPLTYSTSSLVLQFNGAPLVNEGQRLSQCRVKTFAGEPGSAYSLASAGGLAFQLSPSGTWHGPEWSSGSFSSGSTVYASGLQPFAFLATASIVFTGSYVDLTGSVPNVTPGATLAGHLIGTFTPASGNILSSTFYLPDGVTQVVSGVAQFSGTFAGIEGNYSLTGTFLPTAGFAQYFSGTYAYSASGVFVPTGTLLPPGFYSESIPQYLQGSGDANYWWDNRFTSPAYVTFIGATDFLIMHHKGSSTAAAGFHIEIPQRLYPQSVDPNPIAVMAWGSGGPNSTSANYYYAGGVAMHNPPDNSLMNYRGMSRRFFGTSETNAPSNGSNGRWNGAYFNQYNNKFLFMDVVLANASPGQFQTARARLRRVRILPPIVPAFERVGNNGEWLYTHSGVMWPWDNALLPYNLFLGGN